MVDYSKWNTIELSDDDEADCHPNIDINLWKRLKREKREREAAEAEARRKQEEAERLAGIARLKEIDARLSDQEKPPTADEAAALQAERATVQATVDRLEQLRLAEEEKKKKFPKWTAENIAHEKFSKTILSKEDRSKPAPGLAATGAATPAPAAAAPAPAAAAPAPAAAAPAPAPAPAAAATAPAPATAPASAPAAAPAAAAAPAPAPAPAAETPAAAAAAPASGPQPSAGGELTEADVDAWVKQMEMKAHTFAACRNYEDYYKVLQQYPEIMVPETQDYLLLHVSDFIKRGKFDLSKQYLRAACIVQYSLELGPNGVQIFFHRMRDERGHYRKLFEDETLAYWERIRVKLEEMKKKDEAKKAAKAASSDAAKA